MKVGEWYPVAERLSRWARIELLKTLLDAGVKKKEIAGICGVTISAVSHWMGTTTHHPSNDCTVKLLGAAWEKDRGKVEAILRAEAERFAHDLRNLGIDFTRV